MPDIIPDSQKAEIKPAFEERYKALLGSRYEDFVKYSMCYIRKSVRVNTLKISVDDLKKRLEAKWKLTQVPWCREGFWMAGERFDIGNLAEHSLGYFYVQEAASMIPAVVLEPQPDEVVLDMCASPGSKATQIAAMMQNTGLLIANDVTGDRIKPLGINLQRSGVRNSIITLMGGVAFRNSGIKFDRILVDAPCSGTGTIRRNLETLKIWNPVMIKRLAGTQKQLIETAFGVLKEGCAMVYSTCSLEPEEDEGVIDFLLEKFENAKLEKIEMDIKRSPPVHEFEKKRYNDEVKKCLRIWPQDNDTEGFFVARIRKG